MGDTFSQKIKASDVHKVLHMTLEFSSANRTKNWVEENIGHTVVCYSHTVGLATALNYQFFKYPESGLIILSRPRRTKATFIGLSNKHSEYDIISNTLIL